MESTKVISPAQPEAPLDVKQRGKRSTLRKRLKIELAFWGFAAPLLIGLAVFVYIPILWSIFLSFFDARSTIAPTQFVGLANYASMLNDTAYQQALVTITLFALFIIPTTFALSLGLALLVNGIRFAQPFFRSVFFLPTACSYVVASLIWKLDIFNGLPTGFANTILTSLHMDPINTWISSPNPPYYWIVLVSLRLWIQVGVYMLLFIAGLQTIPQELYEAATVDGARRGWTTFRYITFPLLRNTSVAILILNLIAAYQAFDEFYNIMGSTASSGNASLGRPPLLYIFQVALGSQDYGRGSAGAIILAVIIIVFTVVQAKVFGFGKVQS
ncbi:sugar ABC transporter permease [Ktedonobacter sp. SOSP1-52]|uniref:carbohydrate ABC transporter permease n=1 Tax=Ktedonobacter sp. SOSP1-52 TaxID=2778366 RepID=UPI001916BB35|nr:sugar ABC transporter permease [Ktedonobacter sp. SOSP1-52]GHO62671.1 sugar ABC transporter permease [Ktedonobacter sp. SOSP1-52]